MFGIVRRFENWVRTSPRWYGIPAVVGLLFPIGLLAYESSAKVIEKVHLVRTWYGIHGLLWWTLCAVLLLPFLGFVFVEIKALFGQVRVSQESSRALVRMIGVYGVALGLGWVTIGTNFFGLARPIASYQLRDQRIHVAYLSLGQRAGFMPVTPDIALRRLDEQCTTWGTTSTAISNGEGQGASMDSTYQKLVVVAAGAADICDPRILYDPSTADVVGWGDRVEKANYVLGEFITANRTNNSLSTSARKTIDSLFASVCGNDNLIFLPEYGVGKPMEGLDYGYVMVSYGNTERWQKLDRGMAYFSKLPPGDLRIVVIGIKGHTVFENQYAPITETQSHSCPIRIIVTQRP